MIINLSKTKLDIQNLAHRKINTKPIAANFSELVVNKPWGNEYLMFSNKNIEVWNLLINYQRSTSMHCHPKKKTALMVLNGRALFSTLNSSIELGPMDSVIIEKGVFHSTQALSSSGLRVLEFETPPMKHDLVRLEDKYGRATTGYEGISAMVSGDGADIRLADNSLNTNFKFGDYNFYLTDGSLPKSIKTPIVVAVLGGSINVGDDIHKTCDIFELKSVTSIKNLRKQNLLLCIVPTKTSK